MLSRKIITSLVGMYFGVCSASAFANFQVQTNKWPKQEGQYGHSYNETFYDTITNSGQITENEKAELEAALPSDVNDRMYFRLGSGLVIQKLNNIRNKTSAGANINASVANSDARMNAKPAQFAFGWNANGWHTELEYVFNKSMKYDKNPVFTGVADVITSTVSGDTMFANVYYDISRTSVVQPYLMGGVGVSFNKVVSRLGAGVSRRKVMYSLAYNFGAGFRLHFINPAWLSNFFLDFNYRFYILGKARWDDVANAFKLEGSRAMRGFGLGITYVF